MRDALLEQMRRQIREAREDGAYARPSLKPGVLRVKECAPWDSNPEPTD